MYEQIMEKITDRSLRIAVIGLGYVGLPLAVTFAEAGFCVIGIDVDAQKVQRLNACESTIPDVEHTTLQRLVREEKLVCTTEYVLLDEIDAVSICVPTPLRKTGDPDISYILSAVGQIREHLHAGQLIVLESTTYPGTTSEILQPELESTGLQVGKNLFIAFSPERIDPGNTQFDTRNTPKVVGGITPTCTELAAAYYGSIIESVIPVSSAHVAEMTKLLENTFRAVNIGLVNEIAIICQKLNINVWEVIDAASTKPFGFMRFLPGPGLGGHCIPVDPHYLSWKLRTLNYNARFIQLASEVNSSMPHYVVRKINEALNEQRRSPNGSTILILGVAYKRNVGDIRESPALDIIKDLHHYKAQVLYNDDYVPSLTIGGQTLTSQPLTSGLLQAADCVVLVTDHNYYDVVTIAREARSIVDTRNMLRGFTEGKILRL